MSGVYIGATNVGSVIWSNGKITSEFYLFAWRVQKSVRYRCLQHTKQNLRSESKKTDGQTGEPRLGRSEMLPVLVSFLLGSAWFPSTLEFHTFWDDVLRRLGSNAKPTDWGEAGMAKYIEKHLLERHDQGWTARWRSGYAQVPCGMTTYASNTLERTWRTVRGLLKPGSAPSNKGFSVSLIYYIKYLASTTKSRFQVPSFDKLGLTVSDSMFSLG